MELFFPIIFLLFATIATPIFVARWLKQQDMKTMWVVLIAAGSTFLPWMITLFVLLVLTNLGITGPSD